MSDYLKSVPLLDQAAAQIKEGGIFKQDLSPEDLAGIMTGVVGGLLSGQDAVKANVPQMDVHIQGQQGIVKGTIIVEKPIKAEIGINLRLGNDSQPQQLSLLNLDVTEKAGMAARLALRAVNIKGKAEKALRNPNQALFTALSTQLESRGVKLSDIGLNFGQETLAINLRGSSK